MSEQWIITKTNPPKNANSMYWVFVEWEIKMCYLNDYSVLFGDSSKNCWQSSSGDDLDFEDTLYIEVERPLAPLTNEPPKGE